MKRTCGICEEVMPRHPLIRSPIILLGDDLVEIISKHCRGHTKESIAPIICRDCLFEYLTDSQWSVGWSRRTDFLYLVIMKMYHENNLTPARKKTLRWIYKLGTSALSGMCIKCSGPSVYVLKRSGMPNWLLKANDDLLSQYVPRKNFKDYDNVICEECSRKYEVAFIRSIPKEDLPLHVNDKWLFETETLYENRLKNEK